MFLAAAVGSSVSGDDKVVGAVWQIKVEGGAKVEDRTVRFRATPDGKVYDGGSAEVGSWKGDAEKAEIKITGLEGKREKFNGTYVLTQIAKGKEPRWSGKWTPPEGKKSKDVDVRLIRD